MEFYRVGKVIGLTASQEYIFNSSEKHKAILLQNGSGLDGAYQVKFFDASTSNPLGITLTTSSTATANPFILPATLQSIRCSQTRRIVLLN